MADYYTPTVIQQSILDADMTSLELLLLSHIFDAERDSDGWYFFSEQVPAERLMIEQAALQALPAPYRGRSVRSLITPVRKAIVGYQHPLAVYEDLMPGGAA